ncbi:MAG: serine hydrolase [Gemmatimonadetes bacterium]|nr:serine hydrolase [Gemmatimonadota bacterium]
MPPAGDAWETTPPAAAHLDPARVAELIDFARSNESDVDRPADYPARKAAELREALGPHADVEMVGPFTPPGGANGLIVRHGRIAAEFGDTTFVDEIASATKGFLSTLVGVAIARGSIAGVHASVYDGTGLAELASARHRAITWHHLLQQTSEWEGTLFGKPSSGHAGARYGEPLRPPGEWFEYNDVRVNLLARALLEIYRRPLPDVLREFVLDPIGASRTWQWHGYSTSRVSIDGRTIESVSGGAHWGGGLWMSSRDLARYGLLYLRNGEWGAARILPADWIRATRVSSPRNFMYGYLWWLQHDAEGRQVSYAAQGGGSHHVFVVPEHDLVAVVRWLRDEAWPGFLERLLTLATDRPPLGPPHYDFARVNQDTDTDAGAADD